VCAPSLARAVIILDSTQRAAGFAEHEALAREPQFRALFMLRSTEDHSYASGVFAGNDATNGYVLTAAHNYANGAEARHWAYTSSGGTVYRGIALATPPEWNGNPYTRTGFDLTLVKLDRPVTDAGPAPLFYAGSAELGRIVTFLGFGQRGTGSRGHDAMMVASPRVAAAAHGLVEQVLPRRRLATGAADAGNYFAITLPREDGQVRNPLGGRTVPVSRLAGLVANGDSGGPAFMQIDGRWVVCGIASNGTGTGRYGDISYFARTAGLAGWMGSEVPGTRFHPPVAARG